jgi:hypothetical protein
LGCCHAATAEKGSQKFTNFFSSRELEGSAKKTNLLHLFIYLFLKNIFFLSFSQICNAAIMASISTQIST